MTKQEILDRVQDILNQMGPYGDHDSNIQALDLLRHDLENDIIRSNND